MSSVDSEPSSKRRPVVGGARFRACVSLTMMRDAMVVSMLVVCGSALSVTSRRQVAQGFGGACAGALVGSAAAETEQAAAGGRSVGAMQKLASGAFPASAECSFRSI